MANENDRIENKARLWRIFRSKGCYAAVERMQEFTSQEFLERFGILSDFETDCWEVSERLYKKCGGAYKTVERKLPAYRETLSKLLASNQGELQVIMSATLDKRLQDLEKLSETSSRRNKQVWDEVTEQNRKALGTPLKPAWWPELFRKTVWPIFKETHREVLGKAPKETDLAEFIENTSLGLAMRHTIRSFSDMRFTRAVLKKETSAFLSDLKKAQKLYDDALLASLCNRTLYVCGLLSMLGSEMTHAHFYQPQFADAEKLMRDLARRSVGKEDMEGYARAVKEAWKRKGALSGLYHEGLFALIVPDFTKVFTTKDGRTIDMDKASQEANGILQEAQDWFETAIHLDAQIKAQAEDMPSMFR